MPAGNLKSYESLLRAIAAARPKGLSGDGLATARRLLGAWVETAASHQVPLTEALRRLRDGAAARQISLSALDAQVNAGQGISAQAACRSGCAFCCILSGEDGGTIGADEAVRLFDALHPLAGAPDGRDWHPDGCAALDPETLTCRAYEARPLICRTYMSVDAKACESIVNGQPASGTGVLGAQMIHISLMVLSRAVLTGTAMVNSYSLAKLTRAAVEGADRDTALSKARHGPKGLVDEMARLKRDARSA